MNDSSPHVPKLTANLIVLNEVELMDLYLKNTLDYVDEIIVIDGGSTDGTVERLLDVGSPKISLTVWPQEGAAYSEGWREPQRRNLAIEKSTGDWILKKDADEYFMESDYENIRALMSDGNADGYRFHTYHFWGNLHHIRQDTPGDEHWSNEHHWLLWRRDEDIRYRTDLPLHSYLTRTDDSALRLEVANGIKMYHYHWALGRQVKINDLRRADMVDDMGALPPEDSNERLDSAQVRWDKPGVVTRLFDGNHPAVITELLASREAPGNEDADAGR